MRPLLSLFVKVFTGLRFLGLALLFTGLREPEHSVLRKQNRGLNVAEVHLAFMTVLSWYK